MRASSAATTSAFGDTVNRALAGPAPHLIFDLSRLTLMDSSGVALLLQTYKRIRELHGTIALAGLSPSVQRTTSITGVTKLMPVFGTVEEAADIAPVALPPSSASAAGSEPTDREIARDPLQSKREHRCD